MRAACRILALAAPVACLAPGRAEAHAFGQRYDLPLPLGLYLSGAGAAVLLSFVVMALFPVWRGRRWTSFPLLRGPAADALRCAIGPALGVVGVALFLLVLGAGLLGAPSPTRNVAPVLVWVIWWVGFLLFTAFVGNLWPLLSPWATLHRWMARGRRSGREADPPFAYPRWLASWPAAVLLLGFVWLELVGSLGESPRALAAILLGFALLALAGMTLFGRAAFLDDVDPFHKTFGLLGGFAVLGRSRRLPGAPLQLRLPGAGLAERRTDRLSDVAFVMVLLATVVFDGFTETPLWAGVLDGVARSEELRAPLLGLAALGVAPLEAVETLALMVAPLLLSAVYSLFALLAARIGGVGAGIVIRGFAVSLVPIAIAYHLSHYLSYLLLAGQLLIPMASDPFGFGWDLFGTRNYMLDVGIIGAKAVWYLSVAALVSGHVISVILAHGEAQHCFPTARAAVLAQLPFLVLMVGFTAGSLWILAQPVVSQP